jgi:hypothetical protein
MRPRPTNPIRGGGEALTSSVTCFVPGSVPGGSAGPRPDHLDVLGLGGVDETVPLSAPSMYDVSGDDHYLVITIEDDALATHDTTIWTDERQW